MHDLSIGTMHNMKNVETGIFIPSLLFKEYSLKDKIDAPKKGFYTFINSLRSPIFEEPSEYIREYIC